MSTTTATPSITDALDRVIAARTLLAELYASAQDSDEGVTPDLIEAGRCLQHIQAALSPRTSRVRWADLAPEAQAKLLSGVRGVFPRFAV